MSRLLLLVLPVLALRAQAPSALLAPRDLNQLCERSVQLMEAGGVAVPDLQRAAAPVIENVRQACILLRGSSEAGQPTYVLLQNLHAYVALSDTVPRPFPFPDAARAQFAELRDGAARIDAHFRALLDEKDAQLRTDDPFGLKRYAEANRKLPAVKPGSPRIVFLGDSITDAWRLNEYFPDHDFVNRGISGQITGQMLGRMKADVIDVHPDAVLILGGTNDLARGVPVVTIENNYLMIAELASVNKIKPIFASVLPVSDYHKDDNPANERTPGRPPVLIKALNEWLQRFCSDRGYTYLNYFSALVDDAGQIKADVADDGLHPNSKGYRIMAPLAMDAVQKTVGGPALEVPEKPTKRRKASK